MPGRIALPARNLCLRASEATRRSWRANSVSAIRQLRHTIVPSEPLRYKERWVGSLHSWKHKSHLAMIFSFGDYQYFEAKCHPTYMTPTPKPMAAKIPRPNNNSIIVQPPSVIRVNLTSRSISAKYTRFHLIAHSTLLAHGFLPHVLSAWRLAWGIRRLRAVS